MGFFRDFRVFFRIECLCVLNVLNVLTGCLGKSGLDPGQSPIYLVSCLQYL